MYDVALRNVQEVTLPFASADSLHVYHQFTIRVPHRNEVQQSLKEHGVQTFVYYPVPLHLQTMFAALGYKKGDLPVAEQASQEVLSLPMFPEMKWEDVEYVANCLSQSLTGR